jgi:transcriptional regulator with XRE-family HTH domain
MITNAREYQITKSQRARLAQALDRGNSSQSGDELLELERDALRSEIDKLDAEIVEYEQLYEGRKTTVEDVSLEDLPSILIKARIAARLSQKQLAERVGVHMQQIQRYEAGGYRTVGFDRLLEVARALGVKVTQRVLLAEPLLRKALDALASIGLTHEFLKSRRIVVHSDDEKGGYDAAASVDRIGHVFGWTPAVLQASSPLAISTQAAGGALFKLPK